MDFSNIDKIMNVKKTQNVKELRKIPKMKESHSVKKGVLELSNKAEDIKFAFKALRNTPDIRDDKVKDALSNMKDSNFFEKSVSDIADKMIKNIFKGIDIF